MFKGVHTVLMLRPNNFGFNIFTKNTNPFQNEVNATTEFIQQKALLEFDDMVDVLESHHIDVVIFEDSIDEKLPDAVFFNNWMAIMPNKKAFLFPMMAASRRGERRKEIIDTIVDKFDIQELVDWSHFENEDKFLESTGSMVFDFDKDIAYAIESSRTDEKLFHDFCQLNGLQGFYFGAFDMNGVPIYHTNVIMSVAKDYAIICLACIEDLMERNMIKNKLMASGKEVIDLSFNQLNNFAGNCMEVINQLGESKLLISRTAYHALNDTQISIIRKYSDIVQTNISIIERVGGGSTRCMLMGVPS
ncbi:amidinotransferase [Putridiphycobacter roseus]|uniref:Amidinotransferase n=1 Tax=Putridiphycobacter roseus TaxID=2219161 RepID=A0A2W1NMJ9_9FLAO|nr:arginine deiminase-related protein [Putridiphycobacter roseus]PZE16882.1 amidinotransferase [Putridiphycobacter roseus]